MLTRIENLVKRYPELAGCAEAVEKAAALVIACYEQQGTVYIVGNGGSAADASHIVGEFMKGFVRKRPLSAEDKARFTGEDAAYLGERLQYGLRAVSLLGQEGITTAVQNDNGYDMGPAQQLFAFAKPGDVLIGISTSGNARNVSLACQVARAKGLKIIGLTGGKGGKLLANSDVCIVAPYSETYLIQECHLPIYHAICQIVEEHFFEI